MARGQDFQKIKITNFPKISYVLNISKWVYMSIHKATHILKGSRGILANLFVLKQFMFGDKHIAKIN